MSGYSGKPYKSEVDTGDFNLMLQSAAATGNKDMERAMYQTIANSLNPSLMEYVKGGGIEQRVKWANIANEQKDVREQQMMANKMGMMNDESGSGRLIPIDKMMRDPGQGKYSAGSQVQKQQAEKAPQGGGRNRWQEDRDFERGLAQNAQRNNQSLQFSQKQAQQDQAMKLKMLQKIMSQFKSGGSQGGQEGYTEQIFNSAGAPEVVRLRNKDGGQQQQMLMQLLSRFGG